MQMRSIIGVHFNNYINKIHNLVKFSEKNINLSNLMHLYQVKGKIKHLVNDRNYLEDYGTAVGLWKKCVIDIYKIHSIHNSLDIEEILSLVNVYRLLTNIQNITKFDHDKEIDKMMKIITNNFVPFYFYKD